MNTFYDKIASLFSKPETKDEVKSTSTVKELKEYKTRLYSSLSRDLSDFEKNFLFISAGILAFSITFIKDIVRIDTAVYINILFLSWALIAISVGLMMFTFIKSAYSSDKLWFIIDDFQAANNLYIDTDKVSPGDFTNIKEQINKVFKKSKTELKYMRYAAISFFLSGLSLFGFFTAINTYAENHKVTEKKNNIIINFNTKTKQLSVGDVKFSIKDTLISIEK